MSEDASSQLFQKCLVNTHTANSLPVQKGLFTRLRCLPLAITQATAYIKENAISVGEYLLLFNKKVDEFGYILSESHKEHGHSEMYLVGVTWLLSLEQIRRRDSLAAEYLSFMVCVEPNDIPQSLLPLGPSQKEQMDAMAVLSAYSLISTHADGKTFDIHRLVHLAAREWFETEGVLVGLMENAMTRMEEAFPNSNHENRSLWRTYLPHARYLLKSDIVKNHHSTRTNFMWRYGMCLCADERWNEAESSIRRVLETRQKVLGEYHRDTLAAMDALASIYRNQGQLVEAEKLDAQAMKIRGAQLDLLNGAGFCMLSLNSGGVVRGLSSLYILKHIMNWLNHDRKKAKLHAVKPCEVFDLIGGTGTGG